MEIQGLRRLMENNTILPRSSVAQHKKDDDASYFMSLAAFIKLMRMWVWMMFGMQHIVPYISIILSALKIDLVLEGLIEYFFGFSLPFFLRHSYLSFLSVLSFWWSISFSSSGEKIFDLIKSFGDTSPVLFFAALMVKPCISFLSTSPIMWLVLLGLVLTGLYENYSMSQCTMLIIAGILVAKNIIVYFHPLFILTLGAFSNKRRKGTLLLHISPVIIWSMLSQTLAPVMLFLNFGIHFLLVKSCYELPLKAKFLYIEAYLTVFVAAVIFTLLQPLVFGSRFLSLMVMCLPFFCFHHQYRAYFSKEDFSKLSYTLMPFLGFQARLGAKVIQAVRNYVFRGRFHLVSLHAKSYTSIRKFLRSVRRFICDSNVSDGFSYKINPPALDDSRSTFVCDFGGEEHVVKSNNSQLFREIESAVLNSDKAESLRIIDNLSQRSEWENTVIAL